MIQGCGINNENNQEESTSQIVTDIDNHKPRKKHWSILVKPTHGCNLNCQYCYDTPYRKKYGNQVMSFKTVRHILDLATEYAENIQWIWHGGEPTVVGIDWYKKVQEIFYEYANKSNIRQSMQSNGTLLDENWAKFLNDYNINIGVSFDGVSQDIRLNGKKYNVEESLEKFRKAGGTHGLITVINKSNYKQMIKLYENFKEKYGTNVSFNHVYRSDGTLEYDLELTPEEYAKEFIKLYNHWIHDLDSNSINERSLSVLTDMVTAVDDNSVCTFSDCRYNWIGVNPLGGVYPCDRFVPEKYEMGNIHNYDSIEQIYDESKGHKLYALETQKRFMTHCKECGYFDYCKGGCNANHIAVTGDASGVDDFSCDLFKEEFNQVYDLLRDIDIYHEDLNYDFVQVILNRPIFFIKEIKDVLRDMGLSKYIDNLEYTNNGKELLSSQEFKLFRIFNPYRMYNPITKHSDFQEIFVSMDVEVTDGFDFNKVKGNRYEVIRKIYNQYKNEVLEILMNKKGDE